MGRQVVLERVTELCPECGLKGPEGLYSVCDRCNRYVHNACSDGSKDPTKKYYCAECQVFSRCKRDRDAIFYFFHFQNIIQFEITFRP